MINLSRKTCCLFRKDNWAVVNWTPQMVELKPRANGFNICFNIHSILSNNNVETVCHPLLNMLKHVETKSKGCRKCLKGFKLCFNILSIFLLFSKMLKVVETVCAGLSTLSNTRMASSSTENNGLGLNTKYQTSHAILLKQNRNKCWNRLPTRYLASFNIHKHRSIKSNRCWSKCWNRLRGPLHEYKRKNGSGSQIVRYILLSILWNIEKCMPSVKPKLLEWTLSRLRYSLNR